MALIVVIVLAVVMSRSYLDNPNDFPKIGLIAYENSGENLLRVYLERIFNIFTDTNIKSYRSSLFPHRGSLDLSYIIYSDFPLRGDKEYLECSISQGILLVKNPVEVIMNKILKEKAFKGSTSQIEDTILQWTHFHQYWVESPIPVKILRYEDLLHSPMEVLKDLACFLLGVSTVESTKVEHLIKLSLLEDIKQDYYPYELELKKEGDRVYLTRDRLNAIQSKMDQVKDWLGKLNYEDKKSAWLEEFNKKTLGDAIQLHARMTNGAMLSYKALDIFR